MKYHPVYWEKNQDSNYKGWREKYLRKNHSLIILHLDKKVKNQLLPKKHKLKILFSHKMLIDCMDSIDQESTELLI